MNSERPAKGSSAAVRARAAHAPASAVGAPQGDANAAWLLVFGGWLIAAASVLGALFFSEVMALPPCLLCWYQRICMFPLVLILPAGLFPFDPKIVRYALPLSLVGGAIAVFHLLLVAGIVPESVTPCTQGVPCSETQIEWFGFVTIPLLSVVAFAAISVLLIAAHLRISR
jgi:disulfide bond formation protein DsbB